MTREGKINSTFEFTNFAKVLICWLLKILEISVEVQAPYND